MKKVGLVSFPRYLNYGTQLQLYALQTIIEKLGYDCEVIDYERPFLPQNGQSAQWQRFVRLASNPLATFRSLPQRLYERRARHLTQRRHEIYLNFQKQYIHLGDKSYSDFRQLVSDPPQCAAFVVGSDQVWNPIGHFNDSTYYLGFTEESKRIAYAPSIGLSEIPESAKEWMRDCLLSIPHLSVREQVGAELIRQVSERKAQVVLDPTLLLTAEEWGKIAVQPQRQRPYLLCYFLEADSYMRERARKMANELGCDLVLLPVNRCDIDDDKMIGMQKEFDAGPCEFLGLFKQATCVCTDSFHGTVFSILFQRPFFTFRRYSNHHQAALHSRISNILEMTGLHDREISNNSVMPDAPLEFDCSNVDKKLCTWKGTSLAFLENALRVATT